MAESRTTLNTEFFDDLWPLILDENICDINSKNTTDYFEPERPFDYRWGNNFLASKGYKDYKKATEFHGFKEKAIVVDNSKDDISTIEYPGYKEATPDPHQLTKIQNLEISREMLAADFANRTYPWCKAIPFYERDIEISNESLQLFKSPLELNLINKIKTFNCKVMIVDMAIDVEMKELERWLKFKPYVQIIVILHVKALAQELKVLEKIFEFILCEEKPNRTWQKELTNSLHIGHKYAVENSLVRNYTEPIAFVFSVKRGYCACDTFRIIRKK